MPSFRKLSPAEIPAHPSPPSARAQVAQVYDALLADFVIGEYGRVELLDGEQRHVVRQRLQAAARRRSLILRFRPGRGPLTFCVEEVPVVDAALTTAPPIVDAALAAAPASRHQRQERRPAGRYDDVLPRWMRDGHPAGRRGESKRRQGR